MSQTITPNRIQILSPQLANQIAAGEVVERPASVVKELLENSIDAGASQIDIEIEQGGVALIRIRDNGSGIHTDDLVLALASHATSKIKRAADLDGIASLGFRGEALASIASVSRLELNSRQADAEQGWTIVNSRPGLLPSAQLPGTTIEVRDLFYNTPARRKFLRTERTEYLQIEEVVKRVALSRYDIGFSLSHNGRQVFKLRPVHDDDGRERRVATLLGRSFLQDSVELSFEAAGMRLSGRLSLPECSRSQADIQYFFLNGRVIRDKLASHAVRQAYADRLPEGRHAAYLLYLELDPKAVDVNVHPTKHEVRFREARMVHDFLVRAVGSVLGGSTEVSIDMDAAPMPPLPGMSYPPLRPAPVVTDRVNEQVAVYRQLHGDRGNRPLAAASNPTERPHSLGQPLHIVAERFLLVENEAGLLVIDRLKARQAVVLQQIEESLQRQGQLRKQPLLIPHSMSLEAPLIRLLLENSALLDECGITVEAWGESALVVRELPALLAGGDAETLINAIAATLQGKSAVDCRALAPYIAQHAPVPKASTLGQKQMSELLQEVEQRFPDVKSDNVGPFWRLLVSEQLLALVEQGVD